MVATHTPAPDRESKCFPDLADPDLAAKVRRRRQVGLRIRHARERAGLSQIRLALMIDVDREYTVLLVGERCAVEPSPLHLEQLADTLREPVHYFFGGPTAHHPEG